MKHSDNTIFLDYGKLTPMHLTRDITSIESLENGCVATIGNFDGLHLGHQRIIQQLTEQATQHQLPKVIISFEPLPIEHFAAEKALRISPFRDKVKQLEQLGIDHFLCLRFNEAFANMPPESFVQNALINHFKVRSLVVGDDFCFGSNRQGNYELLQSMGRQHGMQVSNNQTCSDESGRISSTRIRHHLQQGEMEAARKLLGRNYTLSGRVRHGNKLGRTINFPTMNLRIQDNIAAAKGVYAVKLHGINNQVLKGVANLGNRPTVGGTETRLEIHAFDFTQSVYGQHVEVELETFIRAEKRFADFSALREQIQQDAALAKELLHTQTL